eukprot:6262787-Prymnesium_polylepis.1
MDMRWARRVLHARLVHQLLELAGHKLASVVGVQSADHASEGTGVAVEPLTLALNAATNRRTNLGASDLRFMW